MPTLPARRPPSGWAEFWGICRGACVNAYKDGMIGTAKGAAYSGLLSFFPLLTTVAVVLVLANAEAVRRTLYRLLFEVAPPSTEGIIGITLRPRTGRLVPLLTFSTLLGLWAGSGVTTSLMQGFQAAYRIKSRRSWTRQRLIAFGLVMALILPFILASTLILFGLQRESALAWVLGVSDPVKQGWLIVASRAAQYTVALATVVIVTALLYYWGPQWERRWSAVWPGAMLATALWLIATALFGWYVRNIANYDVLYGSVGTVVALLVWMYVLAVITLFGCEFNAELERQRTAASELTEPANAA